MRDGCPFCDYEGPSKVLHDFGDAIAIEPLRQVTAGHILIVPKTHVTDFADDPAVTGLTFQRAAEWVADSPLDFNLITSRGCLATQTVLHLHVHVLPRRQDDGLQLPWGHKVVTPADQVGRVAG